MVHRWAMAAIAWGWLVDVVACIEADTPVVVAATEPCEDSRAVHEHPATVVVVVYRQCPGACPESYRTIEVVACHVAVELPGAEHMTKVAVADVPPGAVYVGTGVHIEQVVEVYLIHCIKL